MTSAGSSYRPRRKKGTQLVGAPSTSGALVRHRPGSSAAAPAFPLVAFLWPARAGVPQWVVVSVVLLIVGLFRWTTALWGYSGEGVAPMHGDFEAQRHWMEITTHLPIAQWYFYDLEYWGLDYPPLTAYHSWLLGKIGSLVSPEWFALDSSRGIENPALKLFMRFTVLVSEYAVYVPAVIIFIQRNARLQGIHTWTCTIATIAVLMQPATILIDHGHFQYNTVMLGFFIASVTSIYADRLRWACVFFVGALAFKQMALYYAPVIFCYLLRSCLFPLRLGRLINIAVVTAGSFSLLVVPLALGVLSEEAEPRQTPPLLRAISLPLGPKSWLYRFIVQLAQLVHRIFPFARGLFEDKVANAWCALHIFYKLNRIPQSLLQRLSLGATGLVIAPSCLVMLMRPRPRLLLLALASCAWGFFLCAFQVHEKSVLLPLLPMTLLLADSGSGGGGLHHPARAWVGWANALAFYTLFPLLARDGLRIPYTVFVLLWAYLLGLPPTSLDVYRHEKIEGVSALTRAIHLAYYAAIVAWHIGEAFIKPPAGKPDIWVVLNVLVGASGFGILYVWTTWQLIERAFELSGRRLKDTDRKR